MTHINIRDEVDKIVFRCFDQGTYWGKLAYSENERPDKPDEPIDRTEAVKAILTTLEAAIKEAENNAVEKWCTELFRDDPKKEANLKQLLSRRVK